MRLNESHIKYIETLDGLSLADRLKSYMAHYDISQARAMQVLNEYSKLKFSESFNKPNLKCPKCGSEHVEPAFAHKLNHCLSCWLAFDTIED